MKALKHFSCYLVCCILWSGCLLSGCKRDIPELPTDELRNVTFRLAGFETETMPLDAPQAMALTALDVGRGGAYALRNIEPSLEPQYLYFWSFNSEDLEPDIAVDEVGAGITFEANVTEADFGAGFGMAPIKEAGQAISLKGLTSLEITMPLQNVEAVTDLAFDVSSSGTGPKDFQLSYSVDGGNTYEILSGSNQFENMNNQSRNRYEFPIESSLHFDGIADIRFLFQFLPGNRDGANDYKESTGVVKLDNIRLTGVYNTDTESITSDMPATLHYYIFSSEDGKVVQQQQLAMSALGSGGALDVKLADGSYDVLFVAYRSDKGVLLPVNVTNANEFYFGQHFDDYRAVTYAVLLDDLVIDGDNTAVTATLSRCYSRVEFDFTDLTTDLQRVKKIEITREHDNFLYTPFGLPAEVQLSDAHTIEFSEYDSVEDYEIAFHQYFGLLVGTVAVSYELTAYGEGGVVLNTVKINHDAPNNVRLRLTGQLLGNSGVINGFSVALDTEWSELLEHDF